MELLPSTLAVSPVFRGGPRALAHDGQAGAIDDEMDGARGREATEHHSELLTPPRECGVVRRPSRPGPTARTPPSGARASRRRAGGPTRSRSPHPRTASARRVDRRATGATRPWHRQRATGSRHLAGRALARTPASSPTRYVVLYFGGTLDFISRIVRRPRQQDQPVDEARRSEDQEPCTKVASISQAGTDAPMSRHSFRWPG